MTAAGQDGCNVRHALLREVLDADLLPGERSRLHAGYARVLTQQPELADGPPAVATAELAADWDAAGEPARALPARVQAGLAALDQAVRILPAEPSTGRAHVLAYHAQLLMLAGRYREAVGRAEALAVALAA
jgi:hypothetical protein